MSVRRRDPPRASHDLVGTDVRAHWVCQPSCYRVQLKVKSDRVDLKVVQITQNGPPPGVRQIVT